VPVVRYSQYFALFLIVYFSFIHIIQKVNDPSLADEYLLLMAAAASIDLAPSVTIVEKMPSMPKNQTNHVGADFNGACHGNARMR